MILRFGAFELDCERFELCRDGTLLDLQPRVLGVIEYLVRSRDRLVTRAELQAAVWRGVHVEEDSLYRAVAIARRILRTGSGDADPIRTQRGRGYRFVAPVVAVERAARARALPALPGRADALAALEAALDRARTGHRELVAIRGEAGIGKTRLVETFAADLRRGSDAEVASGRCVEPLAGAEPYSPLLEAIGRLARRAESDALDVIASRAPSWLAQLPSLGEPRAPRRAPTREQLVEELADALETLAAQRPLVLVLEDLHWSDYATLGLLSSLAQRTEPAALLIVATIRSGEPAAPGDPLGKLVAELIGKRLCTELVLEPLDADGVRQVLESRAGSVAPELVQWLAVRSGGNPLFLHHLIDFAEAGEGSVASLEVPARLADLLWHRTASLGDDAVELLGAASAAGVEFCAAEVAAALGADPLDVAERCEDLAQREICLTRVGVAEWPDGTFTERFRFRHVLQRDALYARTAPARRRVHHRRIAERLESAWGERSGEIATLLAAHWEAAGDASAALRAYRVAIESAARCRAGHDARALAERAFALLDRREESARAADELAIRFALAPALPAALGYADPAVEANLLRAQELCERVGDGERRLAILWSRSYARFQAGEPEASLALAHELLDAAHALGRPAFELLAHDALAFSHHKTCRFEASQRHSEQVLALYDPERHAELCDWVGQDVAVDAAIVSAFNLWNLGRPGAAQQRIEDAVAFARRAHHAYSLVYALCYAAAFHLTAEQHERAIACAEEAGALARAECLPLYRGFAELMRAAALPREGGRLNAMLHALPGLRMADQSDEARTSGTTAVRALFVAAFADEGLRDMARAQLDEAFAAVDASGEHHQLPGLHLLRALLAQDEAEVEREIARALAVACERSLGMGALQAALELARLRVRQGRDEEARALLAEQLARFGDEPDVPLLARARGLASELGAPA